MATNNDEEPTIEQQLALCRARLAKFADDLEANKETINQLKSALTVKAEFFAQVNHELRPPLNGMLPMIEMILRSELSDETRDYVLTLRTASLSLLNIINDVLDFSKFEAGRFEVASAQVDLAETVEGVAQILAPAAASKNILLLSVIDKDVPETIIGDPQKIRQVLLNLSGNAIKFTETGVVTIKVSTVKPENMPKQLLFTVSDSGPGISPELMSHLFEPFFQGPIAKENQISGTGLGLSISKHLVELMAGKMFVDSTLSVGSTFGFSLPQEELVNQEILKVWASPRTELDSLAQEQARTAARTTKFSALTLEPAHDGKFAICDLLKTFDLPTRAMDSAQ